MPTIDLSTLAGEDVAVLIGQDRGVAARAALHVDQYDIVGDPVEVVIPQHLRTLTPSFVQGLFAKSVHQLGETAFYAHYQFNAPERLIADVRAGVNRALTSRRIAGGN